MNQFFGKFLFADAFDVMKQIEDKSVDLIFTSPPDLGEMQTETSLREYRDFQKRFCLEFARIVKPKGFIVLSQSDRKIGGRIFSHNAFYIQTLVSMKMKLKDQKILVKRPPVGRKDLYRFTYQHLSIWSHKGGFTRKGDFVRDIIVDNETTQQTKGIFTWTQTFCKEVISNLTKESEIVFDPFAATAPVLFAAKSLQRKYFGCENNETIFNIGTENLEAGNYPK